MASLAQSTECLALRRRRMTPLLASEAPRPGPQGGERRGRGKMSLARTEAAPSGDIPDRGASVGEGPYIWSPPTGALVP
eukprot:349258-Pyramimonas_sp.AAC.1